MVGIIVADRIVDNSSIINDENDCNGYRCGDSDDNYYVFSFDDGFTNPANN